MESLETISDRLEKLGELGEEAPHEQEFPNMLILMFIVVIIAAIVMGTLFALQGNNTVQNILGTHPQRT